MERTTLTSRRLVLSPPTEEDVDTITELCQDPAIQKWTTVPAPYTRESAESFIEDVVVPSWEETSPTWAIRFSQDGPLIGTIALTGKDGTAELGFWLSAAHRGAGLVSEAAARVIDFGFQEMGLASILWRCEIVDGEPNWPSARVAWKCGFTFEGRVRRMIANKGEAHDALVASILPEDSREPKGPWFGPDCRHPAFADPRDPEALVRQFHETYGLPLVADGPEADETAGVERAFGADADGRVALTRNLHAFRVAVRREMFRRIELMARDDVEGLGRLDAPSGWGEDRWDEALARYWDEYDWIGTDTAARATALAPLEESPDAVALAAAGVSERLIEALEASGRKVWLATQVVDDPDGDHDWRLTALVDLAECDAAERAVVHLLNVGPRS